MGQSRPVRLLVLPAELQALVYCKSLEGTVSTITLSNTRAEEFKIDARSRRRTRQPQYTHRYKESSATQNRHAF